MSPQQNQLVSLLLASIFSLSLHVHEPHHRLERRKVLDSSNIRHNLQIVDQKLFMEELSSLFYLRMNDGIFYNVQSLYFKTFFLIRMEILENKLKHWSHASLAIYLHLRLEPAYLIGAPFNSRVSSSPCLQVLGLLKKLANTNTVSYLVSSSLTK